MRCPVLTKPQVEAWRGVVMALVTAMYLMPPPAFAQAVADVPVVMSSAGGISKGSYQAGVDWTISEFLRRQQDPGFRKDLYETRLVDLLGGQQPRYFDLQSATGASAGNINAVFAALGWCTQTVPAGTKRRHEIAPEQSLFWNTWINTGVAELLPKDPHAEASVLTRAFIEERHHATIKQFLEDAHAEAGCSVPVGLTITKVVPEHVTITGDDPRDDSVKVGVQRFASVLSVGAAGDEYLDFGVLGSVPASYGALALLPELRGQSRERRGPRLDGVFDVMLASSAFPVAFAPKKVCYEPAGLLKPTPGRTVTCAQFSDGGLFDNNPIGLAVRLTEGLADAGRSVNVIYSSPGNLRGPIALARRREEQPKDLSGLGAAASLVLNAFQAARDYELQSFRRQVERDWELHRTPRPKLLQSSRRTPIVGETLSSFGAFFGRAFREYDFYTGIYDGLEFVARQFICDDGSRTGPALDTCTANVHARLVRGNELRLGRLARAIATTHLAEEYPDYVPPPTEPQAQPPLDDDPATAEEADRLLMMERIHRSLAKAAPACKSGEDVIVSLLCPGGLGMLLADLSGDAAVSTAADRLVKQCDSTTASRGECTVDEQFRDLLRHPRREVYSMLRRGIRNVERGERKATREGLPALGLPSKVGYSLFRSSTMRYRDGVLGPFEFNRSSSALGTDRPVATTAGWLLPNYVHDIVINDAGDQSALGWQPVTLILGERLYVNSQFELFLSGLDSQTLWSKDVWDHTGRGLSVGTYALPRLPVVRRPTSLDLGVFWLPKSFPAEYSSSSRRTFRASTRLYADKLDVSVFLGPRLKSLSLGLSDLNGIAYWLLRR